MIDAKTGSLRFDEPEFTLNPQTTRSQFLASDVGKRSRTLVENEPYHSWVLPRVRSGLDFVVGVYFTGEQLTLIDLSNADERLGTSWEDETHEKQQLKMASHDRWLSENCKIKPGRYHWGTLETGFSPKDGSTGIWINYRNA